MESKKKMLNQHMQTLRGTHSCDDGDRDDGDSDEGTG